MRFFNKRLNDPVIGKSPDIASANDLPLPASGSADITGTTTINGIQSSPIGTRVTYQFDGALILKHNTAASSGFDSITLPGSIDRTTIAGDIYVFESQGAGNNYRTLSPNHEEGTWTPTIQDASFSDGKGQTYTTQVGRYTRIGNRVLIHGSVLISSLGTLTAGNNAYIGGLPIAASSFSNTTGSISAGRGTSLAITAGYNVSGTITPSAAYISLNLWDNTGGSSNMLISEVSVGASIIFQGQYIV